jgi:hypothetical protein
VAENETKPRPSAFRRFSISSTGLAKRADAKALAKLMQKLSGNKPAIWGPSIVGFDSYHYTYESRREGIAACSCWEGFKRKLSV